jgi:hypothetical protein
VEHADGQCDSYRGLKDATPEFAGFGKQMPQCHCRNQAGRDRCPKTYGYGGNTLDWQARAFGAIGFPIPIKKILVISPTFEVDQEPKQIKYVPGVTVPTDLIYAVRFSRAPDARWSFDIRTGHVGANLGSGINIKVNNAVAFAADFRF